MGLWRYKNGRREKATHSIFIKLNFETQILLAFHHPKFNPPEKGFIPRSLQRDRVFETFNRLYDPHHPQ